MNAFQSQRQLGFQKSWMFSSLWASSASRNHECFPVSEPARLPKMMMFRYLKLLLKIWWYFPVYVNQLVSRNDDVFCSLNQCLQKSWCFLGTEPGGLSKIVMFFCSLKQLCFQKWWCFLGIETDGLPITIIFQALKQLCSQKLWFSRHWKSWASRNHNVFQALIHLGFQKSWCFLSIFNIFGFCIPYAFSLCVYYTCAVYIFSTSLMYTELVFHFFACHFQFVIFFAFAAIHVHV